MLKVFENTKTKQRVHAIQFTDSQAPIYKFLEPCKFKLTLSPNDYVTKTIPKRKGRPSRIDVYSEKEFNTYFKEVTSQ